MGYTLKRKCLHFDEISIIGCTGCCHFPAQPVTKISSKWQHFCFSVLHIMKHSSRVHHLCPSSVPPMTAPLTNSWALLRLHWPWQNNNSNTCSEDWTHVMIAPGLMKQPWRIRVKQTNTSPQSKHEHYDDVTWRSCRLELPVIKLFVQQLKRTHIKETSKSALLALCEWNSLVNSPQKGPVP